MTDKFEDDAPDAGDEMLRRLQAKLYRWDCPTADLLSDYYLQQLSAAEAADVENHLQNCQLCLQELEAFIQFWAKTDREVTDSQDQSHHIPENQNDFWELLLAQTVDYLQSNLGVASVRGEEEKIVKIAFNSGQKARIEFMVGIKKQVDTFKLNVQIICDELWESKLINALIEIWQNESLISLISLKEDDDFAFACQLDNLSPVIIRITPENERTLSCLINLDD